MSSKKLSGPGIGHNLRLLAAVAAIACTACGCSSEYPFVMMIDDHASATRTVTDAVHRISYQYEASYRVGQRVSSKIILTISNGSGKEVSFSNGRIKITSRNIDYEMNDKFIPLPDRIIGPHRSTTLTFAGSGRRTTEEPWQQIAGEQMTVVLRGLFLGGKELPGHTVRFIPVNPKL